MMFHNRTDAGKGWMLEGADAEKGGCRKGQSRVIPFFQSPESKEGLRQENFLAEVHMFFTECLRDPTVRGILDNRYA
jgi:hypothetical protein